MKNCEKSCNNCVYIMHNRDFYPECTAFGCNIYGDDLELGCSEWAPIPPRTILQKIIRNIRCFIRYCVRKIRERLHERKIAKIIKNTGTDKPLPFV